MITEFDRALLFLRKVHGFLYIKVYMNFSGEQPNAMDYLNLNRLDIKIPSLFASGKHIEYSLSIHYLSLPSHEVSLVGFFKI